MDERECEVCGAMFTPPPTATYWRCCSSECWREREDQREHELVERGRTMERRNGRQVTQADLEAAEVRGYQRGQEDLRERLEDNHRRSYAQGYQEGWEAAGPYTQTDLDAAKRGGYRQALEELREEMQRNLANLGALQGSSN